MFLMIDLFLIPYIILYETYLFPSIFLLQNHLLSPLVVKSINLPLCTSIHCTPTMFIQCTIPYTLFNVHSVCLYNVFQLNPSIIIKHIVTTDISKYINK